MESLLHCHAMDLLLHCHEILCDMEMGGLLEVITEDQLAHMGQDVRGVGSFLYDDVLLLNREAKPILSLMITEQGERLVPGSTNTYFEQVIEDHGLKKQDFTVNFLEKLHSFSLSTFHTLTLEDPEWSPVRHRWKFAENFDSVIRARAAWKPRPGAGLPAGWISASAFADCFFLHSEMKLASFVPPGEDPLQQAIFKNMVRADPRALPLEHPLQSQFMQKLYRDVPCLERSSCCRMIVERMFAGTQSQSEAVMTAFKRFIVLLRCHGAGDDRVLAHLQQWKAEGLVCMNHNRRGGDALEKFRVGTLLSLHVYQNSVGNTALEYLHVAVEMLMWCVVCRLHQRMACEAMNLAQHALFLVLSPGLRDSSKWLAIGIARLMAQCYYCRNMRAAAIICQGLSVKICESLDRGQESASDRGFLLRSCEAKNVEESARLSSEMSKWRSWLEEAAPQLHFNDDWRLGMPLFDEVTCLVEQVKLGGTPQFASNFNDMMYTYAMKKWRVLLGNAGRMFHRQKDSERAIPFLTAAFEISDKMQSTAMKLYDQMYIADCMKHALRVEDACRWYNKFFTLAGGLEQALLTQVLHNKPDWAAAVVLGYAEVCCLMWVEKHLDIDKQKAAQLRFQSMVRIKSPAYASVKQAKRLVCQLQTSQDLEDEAKSLSCRLFCQLNDIHDKFLEHKLEFWETCCRSLYTRFFRTWKSNANAMRLLGEEAGAALSKKKKKNKQKKQALARTEEAGAPEVDAPEAVFDAPEAVFEEPEELAAAGVPEKAPDVAPAQEVVPPGEDHDARDATDECCVCMDAPKHFMFAPCGHRCACESCANDVMRTTKECPMCRAAASHIFKVFL